MGSLGKDQLAATQLKYEQERERRLRAEGAAQFVDATRDDKYKHFAEDPWFDPKNPPNVPDVPDGGHAKVLILGTGFGALLFAGRFIESGIDPQDILLVDVAAGFGGTWYWNRYPGLMCDVESASYMPLLEETGYTPKHKYSYGDELREYANLVARKYNIDKRALFRTWIRETEWDEGRGEWLTTLEAVDPGSKGPRQVRSDFIVLAAGILVHPKLPRIPGIEGFNGHMFHTARWDYDYTGGSQFDLTLRGLKDKRVAIIGTGATAIQVVPAIAPWTKELHVFQRTPSSVDVRGQHPITPGTFEKVRTGKGWQRARRENMAAFLSNVSPRPEVDLVQDGWTTFPTFSAIVGNPILKTLPREKTEEYLAEMHALDLLRQERVRERVDAFVQDREIAEGLKPWYAGWCKRPCFHDEYLNAFNRPNVHLVDTQGQGVEEITDAGLRSGDKCTQVDLVIFATGFEPWGQGSPAHRAGIKVTGRDGLSMDDKWATGIGTLHGVMTRGFPNLILPGGAQAGTTVNQVHQMDVYASHAAYIIKKAASRAGSGQKTVIEPTQEGEDEWTKTIVSRSHGLAGLVHCTPSYMNGEGKLAQRTEEESRKGARRANWTPGILDYIKTIEEWEAQGDLSGFETRIKASVAS